MTHTVQRTVQLACILGLVALSGCASTTLSSPVASQDQPTIQALQKRLLERDRTIAIRDHQIEIMSSQLDALKRIEQDTQDQRRSVRRSVIVTP